MRVLVVDDHAVVREGMKQILAEEDDLVLGEAKSGQEALHQLRSQPWDVVVLDISLPDRSGLDILKEIKARYPEVPVLVLTVFGEDLYAVRVLKAGAEGFLTKESLTDELLQAVRRVARRERYLSPPVAQKLAWRFGLQGKAAGHELLSDRELQVLSLIAAGKRLAEIAQVLGISVRTVSTHRTRILTKMGLETTADLIQYAIRNRLVQQ
jgi:DNA-binding NarL/FixJ family response regulator